MPKHVDRNSYIGGADAAAVAGVGLWDSPYSVWARKVGEVPENEREVTERMTWGLLLEKPVAQEWARRESVTDLRSAPFRRHPDFPYVGGHPDFLGVHPVDGDIVIETKLSDRAGQWEGPDGTDNIPLQYFLQVQHYLLITGRRVGYLVVLLRGNELRSWRIERDDEVISGLLDTYAAFWEMVENRTPPEVDGHEATAETLKRRFPQGEEAEIVADLPAIGLLEELALAKADLKDAETRKLLAENLLKERMGAATRLLAPGVVVTWKNNKPSIRTDWQIIAASLRKVVERIREVHPMTVQGVLSDGFGTTDLDEVEGLYTVTTPGARVFRVAAKEEEKG